MLLACAVALPQAIARSAQSEPRESTARVDLLGPEPSRSTQDVAFARDASSSTHRVLFARVALKADRMLEMKAAARAKLPPLAVRRVIAAGNRIADAPYTYGGGHGNWDSGGYDCSGSVSYALHGGGLLDTALASGAFTSWGEAGPGRWITVYANGGHAFMVVAGRRFDTTGRDQSGSRWQDAMRDTSGYVARHPRGL
jgi:hypothetical protein